jgi:hypothetical protein
MKIACIGNYNNMLFSVARYLRDLHLYHFHKSEPTHFHPHADSYLSQEELDKFVFKLESIHFFSLKFNSYFKNIFSKYDFLIGSDWAPAIAERTGRKLDIFIPHRYAIRINLKNCFLRFGRSPSKRQAFIKKEEFKNHRLLFLMKPSVVGKRR